MSGVTGRNTTMPNMPSPNMGNNGSATPLLGATPPPGATPPHSTLNSVFADGSNAAQEIRVGEDLDPMDDSEKSGKKERTKGELVCYGLKETGKFLGKSFLLLVTIAADNGSDPSRISQVALTLWEPSKKNKYEIEKDKAIEEMQTNHEAALKERDDKDKARKECIEKCDILRSYLKDIESIRKNEDKVGLPTHEYGRLRLMLKETHEMFKDAAAKTSMEEVIGKTALNDVLQDQQFKWASDAIKAYENNNGGTPLPPGSLSGKRASSGAASSLPKFAQPPVNTQRSQVTRL